MYLSLIKISIIIEIGDYSYLMMIIYLIIINKIPINSEKSNKD